MDKMFITVIKIIRLIRRRLNIKILFKTNCNECSCEAIKEFISAVRIIIIGRIKNRSLLISCVSPQGKE